MNRVLVILILFLVGCEADKPAPSTVPEVVASVRSQYELVDEMRSALSSTDEMALVHLRREWHGKRYAWEVQVIPVLCTTPQRCNAAPFDHARLGERVLQGWLPRLDLDEESHAQLMRSCASVSTCVVKIEGELALEVSDEEPTAVRLHQIEILGVREAKKGESWVRRLM